MVHLYIPTTDRTTKGLSIFARAALALGSMDRLLPSSPVRTKGIGSFIIRSAN